MDSSFSPTTTHQSPSMINFPIIVIAILGIIIIGIPLLSYYLFLCCSGRLFTSSSTQPFHRRHMMVQRGGLEQAVIRSIPVIKFSRANNNGDKCTVTSSECSVCLSEFKEQELLKVLPNCSHAFHTDCIGTWLQFNSSCPVCRSEITRSEAIASDHIVVLAPLCASIPTDVKVEVQTSTSSSAPAPSANKNKFQKLVSRGDECIDVRVGNNEDFSVQPLRRSVSMDSSNNKQLHLTVQEYLKQKHCTEQDAGSSDEGNSSGGGDAGRSGKIRRSFFSFGWSSKDVVLQVHVDV